MTTPSDSATMIMKNGLKPSVSHDSYMLGLIRDAIVTLYFSNGGKKPKDSDLIAPTLFIDKSGELKETRKQKSIEQWKNKKLGTPSYLQSTGSHSPEENT